MRVRLVQVLILCKTFIYSFYLTLTLKLPGHHDIQLQLSDVTRASFFFLSRQIKSLTNAFPVKLWSPSHKILGGSSRVEGEQEAESEGGSEDTDERWLSQILPGYRGRARFSPSV